MRGRGKYLGCFCKDEMDDLSNAIRRDNSLHEHTFAIVNTGLKESSGEHWMGVIMNKRTNSSGYFDTFGRRFPWLIDTLKKHFNNVHRTRHVVQSEDVSTCSLHVLYFIIRMMDPFNKSSYVRNVNVGNYTRVHYDTKEDNAILKDKDIVRHLSNKFHTNFSMLLTK